MKKLLILSTAALMLGALTTVAHNPDVGKITVPEMVATPTTDLILIDVTPVAAFDMKVSLPETFAEFIPVVNTATIFYPNYYGRIRWQENSITDNRFKSLRQHSYRSPNSSKEHSTVAFTVRC